MIKNYVKSFFLRFVILIVSQLIIVVSLMAASIWTDGNSPYQEKNNYQVGDSIVILLNEVISVGINNNDQFKESRGVNGGGSGTLSFIPTFSPTRKIGTKSDSKVSISHKINLIVAAQVEEVDVSGQIFLRASKIIQINDEQSSISISGYVMPKNIKNGRVESALLKDAVISIHSNHLKTALNIPEKVLQEGETASPDIPEQQKQTLIIDYLNNILGEYFK